MTAACALVDRAASLEDHGSLYGRLWLELLTAWGLSCSGKLDAAWAASERVRGQLPDRRFQLHRWYLESRQVKFLLLEGKHEEAWRRLEELRRRTRFSILGIAQRVSGRWLRAVAALGRAAAEPSTRPRMLAEARAMVRQIEGERVAWCDSIARALRGSIAQVAGDHAEALRVYAEAEVRLATHRQESLLAVTRRERGRMLGGTEGRTQIDLADHWMSEQRVDASIARVLLGGDAP